MGGIAIRPPAPRDVPMLARLHVQCWEETYRGLLPASDLAAKTLEVRLQQWSRILTQGGSRIALAPGLGFAQMGPQRERRPETAGYPDELYCIYLLRQAHGTGLGQALLDAVRGAAPFTAVVVEGNARACAFYEKQGGRLRGMRADRWDGGLRERIYGFGW